MNRKVPDPDPKPFAHGRPDELSEQEWELVEKHHTERRPPHLNRRNFSPANLSNHVADPRIRTATVENGLVKVHLRGPGASNQNTDSSSESGNTDSTLRADIDIGAASCRTYYPHLVFYLGLTRGHKRDADGSAPRLTEQAKKTLDQEYATRQYPGDLVRWIETNEFSFRAPQTTNLGASMLVPNDHGSETSYTTLASWDLVASPVDQTADYVCAAGQQFEDVPAYHGTSGPFITDGLIGD
ncbi:hypothetical protein DL766_007076 [Monosporascus sp. MC13-8B]|uniref:Transposase n=1 Tax=Monosporascus cannonballus TaxID=155416 RepID=A0ABY0GSA6_9PEZI|nr:hypothetical protein DL762_010132 [Monosporascus cannonballus]RYP25357.1 hypothetical protein DL766_007076 [Monosporascus sp. MC13-8B]